MQTIIKDGIYIDLFFEFQPFCLCFVCGPRFLLVEFYPEEFIKPQSRDKHRGMDERLVVPDPCQGPVPDTDPLETNTTSLSFQYSDIDSYFA